MHKYLVPVLLSLNSILLGSSAKLGLAQNPNAKIPASPIPASPYPRMMAPTLNDRMNARRTGRRNRVGSRAICTHIPYGATETSFLK